MNPSAFFVVSPPLHIKLNLGCLQDIPTGEYLTGRHGESILNGGFSYVSGTAGRGNVGKSTMMHGQVLTILNRYACINMNAHDTETTLARGRFSGLSRRHSNLRDIDLEDTGRVTFTDNTTMSGNAWFEATKKFSDSRLNDKKKLLRTTPFLNPKTNENIEIITPYLSELDSLSMLITDVVEEIYDKNQIGESGANTVALRGAAAKSQMLMQLPSLTGQTGLYMTFSIHVGDKHQLDPYKPPSKTLEYMNNKTGFKNVSENVTFLTNTLWYVMDSRPFLNQKTKLPEFPRNSEDSQEKDTDLQVMSINILRNKGGISGIPFELVWSQREGILTSMSEFWYLRCYDNYGIGGNDRNYYLELVPDVTLSRTTVRGKIDGNVKLQRALEITSEMCQMKFLWIDKDNLFITPKELYETLKAKGYDWDVLLDTRGYWVFEEDAANEKPFLSTMDLLRMAKGLYHPYWLPPLTEKSVVSE